MNSFGPIIRINLILFIASFTIINAQNASLFLSPQPLYLGQIPVHSSAERTVSILNNSFGTIEITGITVGGEDAADFDIANNSGTFSLTPLETLVLDVTFTPSRTGEAVALLEIQTGAVITIDTLFGYGTGVVGGVPTFERFFGMEDDIDPKLLTQTTDGGYVVVGTTTLLTETKSDVYVIKTDKYGKKEWSNLYGGNNTEHGNDVVALSDGGVVVVGATQSFTQGDPMNIYLFKIDSEGNKVWENNFGGEFEDNSNKVIQTEDGGFIIAGTTKISAIASADAYVIKTDAQGNLQWSNAYGGQFGENVHDIALAGDGGYILAGAFQESLNPDPYILRIDAAGNEVWARTYPTPIADEVKSIRKTTDGGFIIAGYTTGDNARDGLLLKINSNGDQLWSKSFGGAHSDKFTCAVETDDGGFLCVGAINDYFSLEFIFDDLYVVKTDAAGNLISENQFGGDLHDFATGLIKTAEGGYVISGSTESFDDREEIYLVGVNIDGNITDVDDSMVRTIPKDFSLSQNYPNPFNPTTIIEFNIATQQAEYVTLKVYDILGNEVASLIDNDLAPGNYQVEFNLNEKRALSSGTYFYRISCGNNSITKKMLLLK